MDLGLRGKVALVTGGSFGLGRATAHRLASEGAAVAIMARGAEDLRSAAGELEGSTGGRVLPVVADVSKREEVDRAVAEARASLGPIDIVVSNAGTGNARSFEDMSDELLREDLSLKVYGAVNCVRAALPDLKEMRGAVVTITTPAGKAPGAGLLPTSVSRAAGIALTKALANEYGPLGIRVNTVCVSSFKSRQVRREWERRHAEDAGCSLEQFWSDVGDGVLLGRIGEAEEVADVVVFLASPRASFVTGTAINVDGGSSPVV